MAIKLLFYGQLKKYSQNSDNGEHHTFYPYKQGVTVREILDGMGISVKSVSLVIVNQTKCKLDTPLQDGDCLKVLPKIMGG